MRKNIAWLLVGCVIGSFIYWKVNQPEKLLLGYTAEEWEKIEESAARYREKKYDEQIKYQMALDQLEEEIELKKKYGKWAPLFRDR